MPKRKRTADREADRPGAKLKGAARELVTHFDQAMRRLVLAGNEQDVPESFSRSEIAVLDTVGAEGPMTMGEIAGRVRMPLSTATRVVDRLVVRELVQRERPEDNRRVVRVALAPAGHAFYQAALRSRIAGAQRMLQRLTEDERRELVRLFRKIAEFIAEESME
ncbi:MAG: MarR family transcriptional regulator [Candidatus Binatia bacterium]|jgi:DNA-binding MarR family transcriptional regulator